MKHVTRWAIALALLLPALPAFAQEGDTSIRRTVLMHAFDLDGEAADDDQVVTSANLADSTTYTVLAQPDTCRLIDMTITDANSSTVAGTLAVTGTDCLGYPRVCTFDFSVVATRGSGVKTIPVSSGSGTGCYLGNVASVITSALTGEEGAGTDLVKVGYTTNSANGWALFGKLLKPGPVGEHGVDPFGVTAVPGLPITTSGASSTTVTAVGSNGAFTDVSAGDLLLINYMGRVYSEKVTARASANSITVHQAINLPAAGVPFSYQKAFFSTDPTDEMVIPTNGYATMAIEWSIDANANTGGVVSTVECTDSKTPDWPTALWVTVGPGTSGAVTTASAGTQVPTIFTVDLTAVPFQFCKFALKFGTGDDTDTANEDINASVTLLKGVTR